MRGGDPDVEFGGAHRYQSILGDATHSRNIAGGRRAIFWSSFAGEVVEYMFTSDAGVLTTDRRRRRGADADRPRLIEL